MSRRLYSAVYTAVITVAVAATWAAAFLPISHPTTGWAVNVAVGCIGVLAALAWLPCPCHRKDGA